MKSLPHFFRLAVAILAIFSSGFILSSAHAQSSSAPNLIFDPLQSNTGGSDGGGTWDTGITTDWYQSGDIVFPAPAAPVDLPAGTPDTNVANANFNNAGGTVDVDGAVSPNEVTFAGSGTYTLSPDATNGGSINFNFPASNTGYYAGYYGSGGFLTVNSGNVVIDTPITLNADPNGNTGQLSFENYGSGQLTFNSNINVTGLPGGALINLRCDGPGSILFEGSITNSGPNGIGAVNTTGNFEFDGNVGNAQIDAASGTVLLDTATGYTGLIGQSGAILTNGPLTIGSNLNMFTRGGTFGGATADLSTYESSLANYAGTQTLTAVAGGRVNFAGDLTTGGVGSGNNLVINGAGVIALTNPNGNDYGSQYWGGTNTLVGTEVQKGTLLLENTNGSTSATGAGANQNFDSTNHVSTGANNVVQVDGNISGVPATLGGYGWTYQQVVAMGPTSTFTPGDIDKDGNITPGTLHLFNGLTASSGLTANFDLTSNPSTSSMIALAIASVNPQQTQIPINGAATYALSLSGPVTINLLGTIDPNQTYTLFYSQWDPLPDPWNISGATFTFNGVPSGYVAQENYNSDDMNGNESLTVSFEPVPEPSDWALIGLGVSLLIGTPRFRKLRAWTKQPV